MSRDHRVRDFVCGGSFVQTFRDPNTLAPWTGLLVVVLWVVATLTIAAVVLRCRDA